MQKRKRTRSKPGFMKLTRKTLRAHAPLRLCVKALVICAAALNAPAAEVSKAPVPKSPYIAVVYRYADTLLEKGRDTYGPQKTGLFLSALDRATLTPLTNRPPAPEGVRELDRVGASDGPLVGANLQHDENLLRLLYFLSELTTKPKYRDAADAALKWFFQNAASTATSALPWGDDGSWDVINDIPMAATEDKNGTHHFFRPWLLWDRCFALAPEASKRFALSLADHPRADSCRQAGFYIRTWAAAFAQTKDEQFLKAIERQIPKAVEASLQLKSSLPASTLSLAIDCNGAAHLVPERIVKETRNARDVRPRLDSSLSLDSMLRELAAIDQRVFTFSANLKSSGGFQTTGKREPRTPMWNARSGSQTTAQVAMMCVSRYDNAATLGHRDLFLAAADAYLDSLPGDNEDIWPGTFGHAISLQIAAWRHTAKPIYLERARKFADLAIEKFFGTNALPRASFKSEHYESITGADTLVLALAELHLQVLHITAVRCPPNTLDR
jgi:hypothetical protein